MRECADRGREIHRGRSRIQPQERRLGRGRALDASRPPGPDAAELRRILEAGAAAPDHGGLRPWRFLVVRGAGRAALGRAAVLKLNGGLGTSMGLDQAKSLLVAREGMTFLDFEVQRPQDSMHWRKRTPDWTPPGGGESLLTLRERIVATVNASGGTITNTATVNFAVGGVIQTPVVATSPSFLVDTKVSMTVVPAGGAGSVVNVISGAVKQVIPYQVTNTGNLVNDFLLATANLASGTTFGSPTSYTDNFEASSCGVFVDSNGNNSYDAADTAVYIDELAPDASRRVFVVCDIPAARVNADFSAVNLTATAASGGAANTQGAALVATSGEGPEHGCRGSGRRGWFG